MNTSPDSSSSPTSLGLFEDYPVSSAGYDEALAKAGIPRAHWRDFFTMLNKLGRDELALRWENGRRIIGEHGVTYNVYGDPQGMDRPWELDLIPLVISPEEWRTIEAGLIQRARLLNLILADIYGPQRLLRDGLLPPGLVFANPAFLRPCHGLTVPRHVYLHLHAVDLARAPDGRWWVLGDRTQAPSGSGYALENRIVLSRILPDEFRDCQVQRLAAFFAQHRSTLRALAPTHRDNPNVVLLTPGAHNETFFEHAYLARYLGFTLAEGGDLTVRDCRLFLKTLEGLQAVDVVLRRVDDTFCDPLELRHDSFLGVPGLVEAARAGNVVIANALGSGLIESPLFLAFLPMLCRHLLGEELALPSVPTRWCGHGKDEATVLDNLKRLVIKPAFAQPARQTLFGGSLTQTQLESLAANIRARPQEFVGQDQIALSTAPVWLQNQLQPRRLSLRAYAAATHDSFIVMPGGLTRISSSIGDPSVSMQSGGGSKDTWVLSHGPVSPVSLLSPSGQPAASAPLGGELPSRVADNLYWLGRYVERLEDRLRVLRCVITRLADESAAETSTDLNALVQILMRLELLPPRSPPRGTVKELTEELLPLVYHPQRVGSVRELVLRLRNIMSLVRDRFSTDTWRILNQLQTDSRTRPGRIPVANALSLLNVLIVDLAAFSGMEMENMTRGHGWRFLDFGRRLERGLALMNLLRAALLPDSVPVALEPLLEIADSSMTYRRRYLGQPQLPSLLELLVADGTNPRSFAFQLRALADHAANFPCDPEISAAARETHRTFELAGRLEKADLSAMARQHSLGDPAPLVAWLSQWVLDLSALSNEITHRYFSLTVARLS